MPAPTTYPPKWAGCLVIADRLIICECGWEATADKVTDLWPLFETHRAEVSH